MDQPEDHGASPVQRAIMTDLSRTTITGHELRQWRTEHGMSQTELAHALDVPKDTISRWERDVLGIRHGRILALALHALALAVAESPTPEPADGGTAQN